MELNEIHAKVQEIIRTIFNNHELVILDNTLPSDIEDWDSLNNINITVAIEKEFHVKFQLSELKDLQNVGDMINLIEQKIKL